MDPASEPLPPAAPISGRRSVGDPRHNRLLAAPPDADWLRWRGKLEPYAMPVGQVLYESGVPLTHACFPTTAIVSLMYVTESGASASVAMVGDEGMVGVPLIMGAGSTPGRAVVHSAAAGYRIPGHLLQEEFVRSAAVLRILLRFTQALIAQMAQIAVCNRHHSVDQQLCRWLLLFELLRIPVARILSLIGGQRRGRRDGLAIPLIPAASTLRPVTAPVLVPARRRIRPPAAEVRRWLAVVAHGHAQDVHRHHLGPHPAPGSVVPGARVPVVSLEDPVQAVVEEVVRTQPRRVVHGVSRHECEARIRRQVDADAQAGNGDADPDADLGHRGRRRAPGRSG